jgi:hypothetical protein
MTFDFVEFVTGSVLNRNHIIKHGDIPPVAEGSEAYCSLFRFDEALAEHVKRTSSASGFKGAHRADWLFFDFDCEADLETVLDEAGSFIKSSEVNFDIPPEYWSIAFSGSKGFHLSLPIAAIGNPEASEKFSDAYRAVSTRLALGFPHVDLSIYQINRIIREMGSVNPKTGLYKIPLSFTELATLSTDEIRELAKHPRSIDTFPFEEAEPVPALIELWHEMQTTRIQIPSFRISADLDTLLEPAFNGTRNNKAYSLCRYCLAHHLSEADALALLHYWNKENKEALPEKELLALVGYAFKNNERRNMDESLEVFTLADAERDYEQIVDTPEEEKVRFGLPTLDKRIRVFTPGMVLSIVAKSSNGKSAFAQDVLLRQARRSKSPVIDFSLEMSKSLVFERMFQSQAGMSGKDVESAYREARQTIKQQSALLPAGLENFFISTKSGITIDDIAEVIKAVEDKTGMHPSLIAVDYLSLLGGKGRDIFEKTANNAIALKQLAKNMSVPVIFLTQTRKDISIYTELDENAGKDAGSILDASDFQITIWRKTVEELIAANSEWIEFIMKLTKNRNGSQGQIIRVRMHKITLRWEEIPTNESVP